MLIDFLRSLIEIAELIESVFLESAFLSGFLIGYTLFALLLMVYAVYNAAFGSFWVLLYPENTSLEILILRLCWVMFILIHGLAGIGAFVYLLWKFKRLYLANSRKAIDFEKSDVKMEKAKES